MTEKVIYVADDGTEFDYEDECQEYEWFGIVAPVLDKIQMWNDCNNLIAIPTCYTELITAMEEMHYVRGAIEEFWDAIYDCDLEENIVDWRTFRDEAQSANENDLIMYDNDTDCWVNVNSIFDDYRRILKMFGERG